jgi:hypothetical protein
MSSYYRKRLKAGFCASNIHIFDVNSFYSVFCRRLTHYKRVVCLPKNYGDFLGYTSSKFKNKAQLPIKKKTEGTKSAPSLQWEQGLRVSCNILPLNHEMCTVIFKTFNWCTVSLKGQCLKIVYFRYFSWIIFALAPFQIDNGNKFPQVANKDNNIRLPTPSIAHLVKYSTESIHSTCVNCYPIVSK